MLVPRWFLLPSKLHISKISNMPYDRPCLRSLYPPLLLLYITCQVRYMCMNLSKIYSYRKDIFLRKINTPMGNMKFSIEKQGLPIKIKISRGLRKSDGISLFLIRNLPVWIKFLLEIPFSCMKYSSGRFLENPCRIVYIFCRGIICPMWIIIFLWGINF